MSRGGVGVAWQHVGMHAPSCSSTVLLPVHVERLSNISTAAPLPPTLPLQLLSAARCGEKGVRCSRHVLARHTGKGHWSAMATDLVRHVADEIAADGPAGESFV